MCNGHYIDENEIGMLAQLKASGGNSGNGMCKNLSSHSEQNTMVESSSTKVIRDDLQTTLSRMKMAVARLKFINYQDAIHSLKGKSSVPLQDTPWVFKFDDGFFVCENNGEESLLEKMCPVHRKQMQQFYEHIRTNFPRMFFD